MCAVGVLELQIHTCTNRVSALVTSWFYPNLTVNLTYVPQATNHQFLQTRDQENKQAAQPSLIFHEIIFYTPKCGPFL